MNLPALIARLTEMEGKVQANPDNPATPWRYARSPNGVSQKGEQWYYEYIEFERDGDIYDLCDTSWTPELTQLIAEMRNALPTLLEALAIQREALWECCQCEDDLESCIACEAITRVDALAEKGAKG